MVRQQHEDEIFSTTRESQTVRRWKLLMVAVLLVSMGGIALTIFLHTSNLEVSEFDKQFHDDADKVMKDMGTKLDFSLGAIDALVVSALSFARFTNQTWPYVTIPDFAVRAAKIRAISSAVTLIIYPFVKPNERQEWEAFAARNNQWVDESIDVQSRDDTYHGPILREYETFDFIHTYDYAENGTSSKGPYLPIWCVIESTVHRLSRLCLLYFVF